MAEFIVSARKYRPDTFKTVVGQESITTTLKNSIKTKHLAHAYLFCGPRGVGKTTCARIFAKTINCFNPTSETEPCNECESCKGFNRSGSFNIHELDAASNNSVEGIRNLIDQVRVPPQLGKYNVYIIDEVHMLSSQAFNAFLKTLEEPPAHAIFILATTEKHKIIPTILSRCQLYDFNRININNISGYLQFVANSEGVTAETEALNIIAQKADGAMRDALSIFDQIVSFCGNEITYEKTIQNLNVLDYDYYFKLTETFIQGKVANALILFDEILSKGFDAQYFITGLSNHFRDLLVSKDAITIQLLEVGKAIGERYKIQAAQVTLNFLYKALEISNHSEVTYKSSYNKRLHVELALVKICNLNTDGTPQTQTQVKEEPKANIAASPVSKPVSTYTSATPVTKVEEPKTNKKEEETEKAIKPQSFSIKDALKSKPANNTSIPGDSSGMKAETQADFQFTQDNLNSAWKNYASSHKDGTRTFQLLQTISPRLTENSGIEIPVINKVQETEFRGLYDALLYFLKKELKNSRISLKITLDETIEESTSKPYTDIEKFHYLSQKNPELQKMKDRLNLDFDRT